MTPERPLAPAAAATGPGHAIPITDAAVTTPAAVGPTTPTTATLRHARQFDVSFHPTKHNLLKWVAEDATRLRYVSSTLAKSLRPLPSLVLECLGAFGFRERDDGSGEEFEHSLDPAHNLFERLR